ncbi:uncharacterized protein PPYR1 [Drosophila bipectinata]|uniref:uncharacterized protein PPYR1 n=1 Tax=Drosophila bipectinata TaxID=42026 RepID=UPI001C88FB64|nr:uncharacterized protein LOC108122741 [Drosophila bipectinata]
MNSSGGNRYQLLSLEEENQVIQPNKELHSKANKAPLAEQLQMQSPKRPNSKVEGKIAYALVLKETKKDNVGPQKDALAGVKKNMMLQKKDGNSSDKSGTPSSKPYKTSFSPLRGRRLFGSGAFAKAPNNASPKKLNQKPSESENDFCLPPEMSPERKPSLTGSRHRFNLDRSSRARLHDRQSTSERTGVKAVDKRHGGGSHNWGSPKLDIQEHTKAISRRLSRQPPWRMRTISNSDVSIVSDVTEDESMYFTLDEWRAIETGLSMKSDEPSPESEPTPTCSPPTPLRRSGRQLRLFDIMRLNGKNIEIFKWLQDSWDFHELPLREEPKKMPQEPPKVDDVKQFPKLS